MSDQARDYVQTVADGLIKQLKQGTAPWQKPWNAGQSFLPHNPKSGTVYQGANALWLMAISSAKGYEDNRWLTYKQATEMGGQVQKGEKGTVVQFWQWSEKRPLKGADGRPVTGPDGKAISQTVKLERPWVKNFVVFNAEQVAGLPPAAPRPVGEAWERHASAEAILDNSGVSIRHQPGDKAYYSLQSDQITLPRREQFDAADAYYATALHELGHATGHPSRLNREIGGHPFGSTEYAKEELRAEIASLMVGDQLGIGHDPSQHAAYVGSWIKVLEEDPREIFRAAADAGKMAKFVLGLEQQQVLTDALTPEVVKQAGPVLDAAQYGTLIDRQLGSLVGSGRVAGEAYLAAHTAIFLGQDVAQAAQTGTAETVAETWQREGVGLKSANALLDRARRSADWSGELARAMGLDDETAELATDLRRGLSDLDWTDGAAVSRAQVTGGALAGNDRASAELASAVWQAIAPEGAAAPDWWIAPEQREHPVARQMTGGTPSLELIDALALDRVPEGRSLRQVDGASWWNAEAAAAASLEEPELRLAEIGARPAEGTRLWITTDNQKAGQVAAADLTPDMTGEEERTMTEHRADVPRQADANTHAPLEPARQDTPIDVPFAQKDEAKELGAKWDRKNKSWFVPAGADLAPFAKWRGAEAADAVKVQGQPDAPKQAAGGAVDPQTQFDAVLRHAGFRHEGAPVMDGKIHRVPVLGDKGRERSGAYAGYLDGRPAGWFQNHREGGKQHWKVEGLPSLTPAERAQLTADAQKTREEREAAATVKYAAAAAVAGSIWSAGAEASTAHPYLARKQVGPNGIRIATPDAVAAADQAFGKANHQLRAGDLMVPMKGGLNDELRSLQFIGADGRKGFMPGGQVVGSSFRLGENIPGKTAVVSEGFATAASIHQATGLPVEVAFNAANLGPVAEKMRERDPNGLIIVAGDDDRHLPLRNPPKPNIGREKAEEAAERVGGVVALPAFGPAQDGVDWNDVAVKEGPEGLNRELRDSINREQRRDYREKVEEHLKPDSLAQRTEDRLSAMQDASNGLRVIQGQGQGSMMSAIRPAVQPAAEPPVQVAQQEQTRTNTQTLSRRIGR